MQQNGHLSIEDLQVEYTILHRKVKYPRLEIKTDVLQIIIPINYHGTCELIKKHESWIYKKLSHIKYLQKESEKRKLNLNRTDDEFKEMILFMVENISKEMDLKVNHVKFRRMKSRWGSCSSRRNLNFNLYLKYLPVELAEYIVFHEVTHLVEMGHNKNFWNIISTRYSNYKELEEELSIYWLKVKEFVCI